MRISINDLPEKYRAQAERQLASTDSPASKIADLESPVGNEPLAKKKPAGFGGQVSLVVFEKRHRLADPDGASLKYVLDSIVDAKILPDDNAVIIKKIEKEQVKVPKDVPEETVIEIWRT